MKVTAETLPERQVRLQIEVDDAQQADAMEQAYKRLAPRVQIRGFRPGKAPRPLIEKQLGHHRLLDEAMDILVPVAYKEAIEQEDIDPVAQPAVELVSHEPLVFTATIPLQPVIELGDYQSIKLPREKSQLTDEEVEQAIVDLRRRFGTLEPVERPAMEGDVVRGDLKAQVGDVVLFEQDDIEYHLTDTSLSSLPGLLEQIAGMSKGETKEATFKVPEDFADEKFAGQDAVYTIAVHEVKEEKLAEPNDEFAQLVNESFDSYAMLQTRVREDMQKAADDAALRAFETVAVEALVEKATMEYPAVMVDHEIEHILQDQTNLDPRDPRAVQLYLQRMSMNEEQIRDSVREEAVQRLQRSLVLSHFAEAENITVEDEDVDAEIQTMAAAAGEQAEMLTRLFDNPSSRDSLQRSILGRRTLDRLVELTASDEAAAAAVEEKAAEEPAPPKRRRSAPRQTAQTEAAPAEATQENS